MTVQAVSQNLAYCSWFEAGTLRHGTFAIASLEAEALSPAAAAMQQAGAAIEHAKRMLEHLDVEVPEDRHDRDPQA